MGPLSLVIIVTGLPFSLVSFVLIRKWAKMQEQSRPIIRASRRADLLKSVPTVIIS